MPHPHVQQRRLAPRECRTFFRKLQSQKVSTHRPASTSLFPISSTTTTDPAQPKLPMPSKQPSRKGKKAWRKNVDISDVQSGLEQVREEITQGYVFCWTKAVALAIAHEIQ